MHRADAEPNASDDERTSKVELDDPVALEPMTRERPQPPCKQRTSGEKKQERDTKDDSMRDDELLEW